MYGLCNDGAQRLAYSNSMKLPKSQHLRLSLDGLPPAGCREQLRELGRTGWRRGRPLAVPAAGRARAGLSGGCQDW